MRKLELILVSAALLGCGSAPLGAGGSDEVQFASAEMIRIAWNPQLTDERKVRHQAVAYCSGREVDAVDSSELQGAAGPVRVKTWRCRPATGSGR
jgi:hypothetical protein